MGVSMRSVALGSWVGGGGAGVEKGRKAGGSSSSSLSASSLSASPSDCCNRGLGEVKRGRRWKAWLLEVGSAASESEDEDDELESRSDLAEGESGFCSLG